MYAFSLTPQDRRNPQAAHKAMRGFRDDERSSGSTGLTVTHPKLLFHHITRTPATRFFFHQYAFFYQVLYVAEGGVLAAFGHFGPFGGGELAGKIIGQFGGHKLLAGEAKFSRNEALF